MITIIGIDVIPTIIDIAPIIPIIHFTHIERRN